MLLCLWDTNADMDVNIGEMLIKEGLAARSVTCTDTRNHVSGCKEAFHHHRNGGSLYQDKNKRFANAGLETCDRTFKNSLSGETAVKETHHTNIASQSCSDDNMKGPVDLLGAHGVASFVDQAAAQVKDKSCLGTPSLNQSLQNVQNTDWSVNILQDMHCSTETLNTVNSDLDSKVVHIFTEVFLATIREMKQHLPGILDISESASCKANENDCGKMQAVSGTRFQPEDSHCSGGHCVLKYGSEGSTSLQEKDVCQSLSGSTVLMGDSIKKQMRKCDKDMKIPLASQSFASTQNTSNITQASLHPAELAKTKNDNTISNLDLGMHITRSNQDHSPLPSPQSLSAIQATVASIAHGCSVHEGRRPEEPVICVTSLDKDKDVIYCSDR